MTADPDHDETPSAPDDLEESAPPDEGEELAEAYAALDRVAATPSEAVTPRVRPPAFCSIAKATSYKEPVRWVVDGIIPESSILLMSGAPKKSRKTLICTHMGLCVARGEPVFGSIPVRKQRVIYSYFEDGIKRVGRRAAMFGVNPDTPKGSRENPQFVATFGRDGWNAANLPALIAEDEGDPILWFIDPLVFLEGLYGVKDENDPGEIERLFAPLRDIVQNTRHSIAITHHFKKNEMVKRGSGALDGSTDGCWDFVPQTDGTVRLNGTLRDAPDDSGSLWARVREDGDQLIVEGGREGDAAAPGAGPSAPALGRAVSVSGLRLRIEAQLANRPHDWQSVQAIASALGEKQIERNWRVTAVLNELKEAELAVNRVGRGGGWQATPALVRRAAAAAAGAVVKDSEI